MTIETIDAPQQMTRFAWTYRGFKICQNKNTRSNLHWWVSLNGQTYKLRTKADAVEMIDLHCDN